MNRRTLKRVYDSTRTRHGPPVSIGLPVYNGARYIAATLESLLAQTFEDFELIICDNASDDGTEEICRTYAAKDPRIRYIRNPTNVGAAKNYRLTFELSSGRYFRWANSDDLFATTSLSRCVDVLESEKSTILTYPKTKLIDERGQVISEYEDGLHLQADRASERFNKSLEVGLVNALYGLIRSEVLRRTALIGTFKGADIVFMAELTLYGKFWEIPEFLFYRRLHPEASSSFRSIDQFQEFFDPLTKGRIPFTQWRHFLTCFDAVIRSPIGIAEKTRIGLFLMRKANWKRGVLTREVVEAIRQIMLGRLPRYFLPR